MIDIPVMAAASAPVPNNDSTRMIEGLNVASLLASVAAKGGAKGGGEHTITSEQSGTVDAKGNRRKPVADVKDPQQSQGHRSIPAVCSSSKRRPNSARAKPR